MYNRRKLPAIGSITLNMSDTVLRGEEHMTCIVKSRPFTASYFFVRASDRVLTSTGGHFGFICTEQASVGVYSCRGETMPTL